MKKLIAILISLCLMLAVAGAYAETATTEMSWETVEPLLETYGLEGDFETFDEVAVQIWIPSSMTRSELTQEDVDKGFIAHFLDEDQTAQVSVVYVDVDGTTLEEYEKMLPDYGVSDIEELVINDIPALSYTVEETDSVTIAFETEGGYILEITMAPKSAEGADIAWYIVASSIMEEE
ncbi:MAG: hypothetical protein IJI09_01970 [Clostridia bacterium]|nr:hypothetical protein [Clostridia bacterium]